MQAGIEIIKKKTKQNQKKEQTKKSPETPKQNKHFSQLCFHQDKFQKTATSIHMIHASFYCPPEVLWSRPAYNTKE